MAIENWAENQEAAEKEKYEGTKEEENNHENQPYWCVWIVLTIVLVAKVNDISVDGECRVGENEDATQDECMRNDRITIAPDDPQLVQCK